MSKTVTTTTETINTTTAHVNHTKDAQVNSKAKNWFLSFSITSQALIVSALTLVCALAWDSAFTNLFNNVSWLKWAGPWVYAVLVTILLVVVANIAVGSSKKIVEKNKSVKSYYNPYEMSNY